MKNSLLLLTLFILISNNSLRAQNKPRYTLFSEGSVFRANFQIGDANNYLINTRQKLPEYSHQFDANDPFRTFIIKNDSISRSPFQNIYSARRTKDFRNITIGISSIIIDKRRFTLNHGIGLNYAISNIDIGILYDDHFYIQGDSAHYYENSRDSSFNIQFHEQTKKIGLVYNFSASIKVSRSFHFSIGIRNTLGLNYDDKIFVQYQHEVNSRYYDRPMDCFRPLLDFSTIHLYKNENPDNNDYQVIERKMKPTFDMSLFFKPEFLLGKKKRSTFYMLFGFGLTTKYGKQYHKDGMNGLYGIGISRTF